MKITVFNNCALPHASQIYTGFSLLNQSKAISLTIKKNISATDGFTLPNWITESPPGVFAIVNGEKIFFDLLDSAVINSDILESVNTYFKRSYSTTLYTSDKILPLGLNFEVYLNSFSRHEASRYININLKNSHTPKQKLSTVFDALGISYLPRLNDFNPNHNTPQGNHSILFLARTWDPLEAGAKLTNQEQEDRYKINQQRADLIKHLRSEFGTAFIGGFASTEHSNREFPDFVFSDRSLTKKTNYLQKVKSTPICIATTGLHGSIGWKLAEYVALSRSIITEKTNMQLPGKFLENRNYLSFEKPSDCLAHVKLLLNNHTLRNSMMESNKEYFLNFLHPEKLVANALKALANN